MNSRSDYPSEVEQQVNHSIEMHLSGEYTYHSLSSLCLSDSVASPEFSEFFRFCGCRMRRAADLLRGYQTTRGGKYPSNESSSSGLKSLVQIPNPSQYESKSSEFIGHLIDLAIEMERQTEHQLRSLCHQSSVSQDSSTPCFVQKRLLKSQRFAIKSLVMHQTGLRQSQDISLYRSIVMHPLISKVNSCTSHSESSFQTSGPRRSHESTLCSCLLSHLIVSSLSN
ncbi:unnamed protein product [Protopolystoma xenopodis]|uniref:ferroxidase n=1 Tax=Protopolystoma xenopodis TaxID=117903 RepID=A0A448XPF6_9PLAT|nr:unnamed protein product [Protopolystoma xenopodis]